MTDETNVRLAEDGPAAYRGADIAIQRGEVARVEDWRAEQLLATNFFEEVPEGEADAEMADVERESDDEGRAEGTLTTDDLETESGSAETETSGEDVSDETGDGYTRDELETMGRSELQELAKNADTDEIDGRSSNADIIDTLAEDEGQ